MKKISKKIVFFGNERIATGVSTTAPTLAKLVDAGYEIVALVINNKQQKSRKTRPLEIVQTAEKHGIPVLSPDKLIDIKEELKNLDAEVAVLAAYGKIVPQEIIDIFPSGIINIHPSLLPKHRGSTPIESVILSGEKTTGVSIMKLAKEMDAGPIYAQSYYEIQDKQSKQEICDNLLEIGSQMIIELLPDILSGDVVAEPQNHKLATYDNLIDKKDGQIDWKKPATQIAREVRAFSGWPQSHTAINDISLIVKEVEIVLQSGKPSSYKTTKSELLFYCGKDAISIKTLQPVGKKEMPIQAFLAGYKNKLN